ncbi:MAG TPA: hypothetical protein VK131_04440, partial [Candidatus Acidoferrales bacterium]|nr:hypothetical protein [Candidatus Acidoferrales bacterium]
STLTAGGLLALFAAGFAGSVLRERWVRLIGVMVMLVAATGALWTAIGPVAGLWTVGPGLVTVAAGPGPARRRLVFDPLVRRAAVIGFLAAAATLAALQFSIGDLPRPLAIVVWNLGALGLSWIVVARDARETVSGAVLAIAGGAALLLLASAPGGLTVLLAGGLAAVPALALPRKVRGLEYALAAAAGLTVLLLLWGAPSAVGVGDLAFSLRPPALLAVAILFLGAGALQPGSRGLAVLPATLMLLTASPTLRWAALAASVALLQEPEERDRRLAWAGLTLLATTVVLGGALDPAPRLRLILAGLAGGWLLLVAVRRASVLQTTIAVLFLIMQASSLASSEAGRFQLLAAATAAFLFALMMIEPRDRRRRGSLGLTIVALATLTPTGTLAAMLLVLDAILMESTADAGDVGGWRWLRTLARSGWPPTIAFAGRTLAVLAAIETSSLLAVVSLVLLLALLVVPLVEPQPAPAAAPARRRGLAMAAVSLAIGLVPGWLGRLGHL